MKHPIKQFLALPTLAVLALGLAGVPAVTARDNAASPLAAGRDTVDLDSLKDYPYAQRAEFSAAVRQAVAGLDQQIAALTPADGAAVPPARAKGLQQLRETRRVLDERLGRLELAIAENWESLRAEVLSALHEVRAAYENVIKV